MGQGERVKHRRDVEGTTVAFMTFHAAGFESHVDSGGAAATRILNNRTGRDIRVGGNAFDIWR
jgi:hypothetical protein